MFAQQVKRQRSMSIRGFKLWKRFHRKIIHFWVWFWCHLLKAELDQWLKRKRSKWAVRKRKQARIAWGEGSIYLPSVSCLFALLNLCSLRLEAGAAVPLKRRCILIKTSSPAARCSHTLLLSRGHRHTGSHLHAQKPETHFSIMYDNEAPQRRSCFLPNETHLRHAQTHTHTHLETQT